MIAVFSVAELMREWKTDAWMDYYGDILIQYRDKMIYSDNSI